MRRHSCKCYYKVYDGTSVTGQPGLRNNACVSVRVWVCVCVIFTSLEYTAENYMIIYMCAFYAFLAKHKQSFCYVVTSLFIKLSDTWPSFFSPRLFSPSWWRPLSSSALASLRPSSAPSWMGSSHQNLLWVERKQGKCRHANVQRHPTFLEMSKSST